MMLSKSRLPNVHAMLFRSCDAIVSILHYSAAPFLTTAELTESRQEIRVPEDMFGAGFGNFLIPQVVPLEILVLSGILQSIAFVHSLM